jgi:hypothetical protein
MADKYEYYISTDAKKQILHYGVNTDDPNTKLDPIPIGLANEVVVEAYENRLPELRTAVNILTVSNQENPQFTSYQLKKNLSEDASMVQAKLIMKREEREMRIAMAHAQAPGANQQPPAPAPQQDKAIDFLQTKDAYETNKEELVWWRNVYHWLKMRIAEHDQAVHEKILRELSSVNPHNSNPTKVITLNVLGMARGSAMKEEAEKVLKHVLTEQDTQRAVCAWNAYVVKKMLEWQGHDIDILIKDVDGLVIGNPQLVNLYHFAKNCPVPVPLPESDHPKLKEKYKELSDSIIHGNWMSEIAGAGPRVGKSEDSGPMSIINKYLSGAELLTKQNVAVEGGSSCEVYRDANGNLKANLIEVENAYNVTADKIRTLETKIRRLEKELSEEKRLSKSGTAKDSSQSFSDITYLWNALKAAQPDFSFTPKSSWKPPSNNSRGSNNNRNGGSYRNRNNNNRQVQGNGSENDEGPN